MRFTALASLALVVAGCTTPTHGAPAHHAANHAFETLEFLECHGFALGVYRTTQTFVPAGYTPASPGYVYLQAELCPGSFLNGTALGAAQYALITFASTQGPVLVAMVTNNSKVADAMRLIGLPVENGTITLAPDAGVAPFSVQAQTFSLAGNLVSDGTPNSSAVTNNTLLVGPTNSSFQIVEKADRTDLDSGAMLLEAKGGALATATSEPVVGSGGPRDFSKISYERLP